MLSTHPSSDSSVHVHTEVAPVKNNSRLEAWGFHIFLAAIFLAPLIFVPTPYVSLNLVKIGLIAVCSLISAIIYTVLAIKERSLVLPPRSILWTSKGIALSVIVSALVSGSIIKSFFGQGFEVTTASFILILLVDLFLVYIVIQRRPTRLNLIYTATGASFVILVAFHFLRFVFGNGFSTLGILNTLTSTVLGSWASFSIYALGVVIVSLSGLALIPLSRKNKVATYLLLVISLIVAGLIDNSSSVWFVASIVLLGLCIYLFVSAPKTEGSVYARIAKRIHWLSLTLCIVALVFSFQSSRIAGKAIQSIHAQYSELSLPWQQTIDVAAGTFKDRPFFGAGLNRFSQAYISYKPSIVNTTDAWGAEFNTGFAFLPTLVIDQGIVGLITWILFFVFLGILGVRGLRKAGSSTQRFAVVSSGLLSLFLWLTLLVAVPAHVIIFYTFIFTGAFIALTVSIGAERPSDLPSVFKNLLYRYASVIGIIGIVVLALWGIVYIKKSVALSYFGYGVKQLNVNANPMLADAAFKTALAFDSSDIYWQARTEAMISRSNALAASVNATTPASTSQAIASEVVVALKDGRTYADRAIEYDPTSYYNYVSRARVAEVASSLHVDAQAYQNGTDSYVQAIKRNPYNPSLYLSLARLQASQNHLDEALKSVGAALQVKNNYIDAIFLLSQINAAQGNLKDAITAVGVALQINPQNHVLYFQLGLLHYNNKSYDAAAQAFEKALTIQKEYANAKYFLGLSYARLNKTTEAISQFEELLQNNPDNQEVKLILSNLKSGKSPFADAKSPVTASPEKRPTLPVKQK